MAKIEKTSEEIELWKLNEILNSFDYDNEYRMNANRFTSPKVCKSQSDLVAAKRNLEDFLATNPEHRRLVTAIAKAEVCFTREKEADNLCRVRDVKRARNLLRLNGLTAESRKAVADLMRKYQ